jgi:hypothetical protein
MKPGDKPLYLCAGTQSSGSTLISWCFLQRQDMDGVLDARGDILPQIPHTISAPNVWCKTTINCFRMREMIQYFEDEGWTVRPLLVVRDVRAVWNSLSKKSYGRNGTTAEEPPLRIRMRRFKEDWELFSERGWPMLKYEAFVSEADKALRELCAKMGLPWDEGMLIWKKGKEEIAAAVHGNATFRETRGGSLAETVNPSLVALKTDNIAPADLRWLEKQFADFNSEMGYPPRAEVSKEFSDPNARAVPSWENTRRYLKRNKKWRLLKTIREMWGRA